MLTQSLVDSLFVHYDASQIPICTKGGNTTVKFDVALRQIMDMVRRNNLIGSTLSLVATHSKKRSGSLKGG